MRTLFVYAPKESKKVYGKTPSIGSQVPLGILYIASYLRERHPELDMKVLDGSILGFSNTMEEIAAFRPDVLCVSYSTLEATAAYALIDGVKKALPGTFVVVGGPHVTALPAEALSRSCADVEVVGEGEQTAHELFNLLCSQEDWSSLDLSSIDGVVFRQGKEIRTTAPRRFIDDLDSIPFPARDLLDLSKYQDWAFSKEKGGLQTNVLMSRGCPFSCTFCANSVWRSSSPRYRMRSPKNIVDEMEQLVKEYGVREFFDSGDDFNIDINNSMAICEEISRRELGIAWQTSLRAHPITDGFARALADSGCWFVFLGIESGNLETLQGIKKQITPEQVVEACKTLKKYGIKVFGLFMLFNVWEENGDLRYEDVPMCDNTLRFASRLLEDGLLDYISWSQTTPHPGSELYKIAERHGLIRQDLIGRWGAWSWAMWLGQVMQLPGLDPRTQMAMRMKGNRMVAWHMYRAKKDVRHLLRFYASRFIRLQMFRFGIGVKR